MQLLDADLNSDRNRAIVRFLFGKAGQAIARVFPTRAAACYSGLVTGFALAFLPIAKEVPTKITLMTTLAGAGLVAVSAHELDELQDDLDEVKAQKERDRQLRQFADTEAKNKVAETNLLRHGYELDQSLPEPLRQAIAPATEPPPLPQNDRATFDAAVAAAQTEPPQSSIQQNAPAPPSEQPTPETTTLTLAPSPAPTNFTATMAQIAQRLVSMTVIGVPGAGKTPERDTCENVHLVLR